MSVLSHALRIAQNRSNPLSSGRDDVQRFSGPCFRLDLGSGATRFAPFSGQGFQMDEAGGFRRSFASMHLKVPVAQGSDEMLFLVKMQSTLSIKAVELCNWQELIVRVRYTDRFLEETDKLLMRILNLDGLVDEIVKDEMLAV